MELQVLKKELSKKDTFYRCLRLSICLCLASTAILTSAEEKSFYETNAKLGFFNHDSVVNLDAPLSYSNQEEIQFGPSKGFDLSQEFAVNKVSQKSNNGEAAASALEEEIPEGVDPQEYTLRKEFGDPSEAVPVKGVDTAPKPYKAMLKAIDMGRDDLALEYAQQWMGYMKSLDKVTKKASAMAGLVGADPSKIDAVAGQEAVTNIDPRAVVNFVEQRKVEDKISAISSLELDSEAKNKIDALFGQDSDTVSIDKQVNKDPYADLLDKNININQRKLLIRTKLAGKVPVEPGSAVKILYFIKPSQLNSVEVAKELTTAVSSSSLDVSVSVVPLSVESIGYATNQNFFKQTGMPAIIRDGAALARSLGVNQTPALIFSTDKAEKAFVKVGLADSVFIEEVIKMMGGR
jgi:hypothetical protein